MALDIDGAILAHAQWKTKLATYVKKPDGTIDVPTLARCDACVLGKWLDSDAKRTLPPAAHQELHKAHAAFHVSAADVAKRANSGEKVDSEVALCATSEFGRTSAKVIQLLSALRQPEQRR